ncbi:MAG: hypothetical protein H0V44_12770 [Planctomycetes bacterium]|nr:hypothetical protein [Planctomycetota bacterium]
MWWPLHGLGTFLKHPALWRRPLAFLLVGWVLLVSTGAGVAWWRWPADAANWWPWPMHIFLAIGLGIVSAMAVWILIMPVLMMFALEGLARGIQRAAGAPEATEESLTRSLGSTMRVLLRTLPLRIAWTGAALIASFFGPLGLLVGAFAMAHLAAIDAMDTALSVRGISGSERVVLMRRHRDELVGGAMVGAVLNLALGVTVIGWILWLPGMVAGAALRVLSWPEVAPPTPTLAPPQHQPQPPEPPTPTLNAPPV